MTYVPAPKRPKLQHLRAWRQYRLMSQFDLTVRSGISITTISHVEDQHYAPQWATIDLLAKGLDITKEQLVYEAPPETSATWVEKKAVGGRKKKVS